MRKTKEVLRLRFELGLGQREIAPQLRDWAGYGPRVFGAGSGGRDRLAVARRLERRGTGSQAVWEPVRAGESGAATAATGLESHS
jgi:hypothetical protein